MTKFKNIILGSGITALLARHILGSEWTIIPFKPSRFYSFMPALHDNFIIHDQKISNVIQSFGGTPKYVYQIKYSVRGNISNHGISICDAWLNKKFSGNPPPHAAAYMKGRQQFFIYDLRVNQLYNQLQNSFKKEIMELHGLGTVQSIGDHYVVINNIKYDYDRCISTIPLDALLEKCSIGNVQLESRPYWIFHIQTDSLDFEGSNQLLVIDPEIDFYKVVKIDTNRYMFYCNKELLQPGPYFMGYMKNFDIIDGTMMTGGIICGPKPNISALKQLDITCIGSYAEWDWCADVGSNIMSILRYKKP